MTVLYVTQSLISMRKGVKGFKSLHKNVSPCMATEIIKYHLALRACCTAELAKTYSLVGKQVYLVYLQFM